MPQEWEACLDSWILLAQAHLLLPQKSFSLSLRKNPSLTEFLLSYLRQNSIIEHQTSDDTQKSRSLKSKVFLLMHRALTDGDPTPLPLLEVRFLEDLSVVYGKSASLKELLVNIWPSIDLENASSSFLKRKASLIRMAEAGSKGASSGALENALEPTVSLLRAAFTYGQFLMVGSDFLDFLASCYEHEELGVQKKITVIAYLCLTSLLEPSSPKISTLIDHLYGLGNQSKLRRDICSSTPFLRKLRTRLSGSEATRAKSLLQELSVFEKTASGKPRNLIRRKTDKGKNRATDDFGHGAYGDVRVHTMSLITQVQDIFPDLGSAFIVKLLDEYNNDTEQVTAHLLEDSLPAHLKQADRAENLSVNPTSRLKTTLKLYRPHLPSAQSAELVPNLAPHSPSALTHHPDRLAPLSRRTVFDDDAFSNLAISPSQVHYGRAADTTQTADDLLSAPSSTANKAAILSALAAFDADDDERDDTYDVEDVGGTVDSALPGTTDDIMDSEGLKKAQHEETLFQAWKMSPALFGRDPTTRRSQARVALRSETAMTDEAIEGWAIMLQRDPRKLKRLEAKSSTAAGTGQQRGLGRTAWMNTPADSGTGTEEEADTDGDTPPAGVGRGGGAIGRGRGAGRGGRGGNVAGPADDRATQLARRRKDQRANHNRRDQRARKLARGGLPG